MNWNINKILKIYGIWYLIVSFICFLLGFFDYGNDIDIMKILSIIGYSIQISFAIPVLSALVFSPAISVLYLLFKKIKNVIARIFLVAFIVPFSNMIYYLTEYFIYKDRYGISLIIGFWALFVVLPLFGLTSLFIPKSLLPIKQKVLWTIVLMEIIGWILVHISFIIAPLEFVD